MKIIVLCENKNALRLLNKLFVGDSDFNLNLITCDWGTNVLDWVSVDETDVLNILNESEKSEVKKTNDRITLENYLSTKCQIFLSENSCDAVLMFNDSSVRGKSFSLAALNLNIKRILIQDGHLDFESKSNNLSKSNNYYYGATKPEQIFVWGEGLKNQICMAHGVSEKNIIVSGHIESNALKNESCSAKSKKILFVDQPLIDQNVMSKENWSAEYLQLLNVLSKFDVTIKLHPSTTLNTIEAIEHITDSKCELIYESFITDEEINKYGLLITYYSTFYIDALQNGKPIIFYNLPSCDIVMPKIKHPLISNAHSLEELEDIIDEFIFTDHFRSNNNGKDLSYYINSNQGCMIIKDTIKKIQSYESKNNKKKISNTNDAMLNVCSLEYQILSEEYPRSLLIIGTDFGSNTGVAYPINNYTNFMKTISNQEAVFFLVNDTTPEEQLISFAKKFTYIIINSLAFFFRYSSATNVIRELHNKHIYIYAHETEYTINDAKNNRRKNYIQFMKIAPSLFYLCVSQKQKCLFETFGWNKSTLIYNCIDMPPITQDIPIEPSDSVKIVMVGTIQDRKGAKLFCQVADLAFQQNKNFEFIWIGSLTKNCTTQLSSNVKWLGFKSRYEIFDYIQEASLFFLPSIDDPFPLSLLEAAYYNKKIVCYSKVGSVDIFNGVKGFQSFTRYTPQDALSSITSIIYEQDEVNTNSISKYFLPDYFALRLHYALMSRKFDASNRNISSVKATPPVKAKSSFKRKIKKFFRNPYIFFKDSKIF